MANPQIVSFSLGDFQTNCFVVTAPGNDQATANHCWIVDCGYEPEPLLDYITQNELNPVALLLTHAHSDHIAGVDKALSRFGDMPMYIHEAEAGFCGNPTMNLSSFLGTPITATEPQHHLVDGQTLQLNETTWRIAHAPGHSPGCVLFIHDESNQAIAGDTLFAGSIGRIDFPTSSPDDMRRSITDVLMALPDDMTIHPGHGPSTTIGRERQTNPYVLGGF